MRVERVVIAGAGLAGLRAAEELRGRDYPGAITMVGAESRPPYDRPPLTKKFMTGQLDDTTLAADPAALGLELRLDEAATGVDAGVLRTDRAEYPFDALVVATGATPVGLPGGGGRRFLRTFDDARALRDALRPGTRLAVVGAGGSAPNSPPPPSPAAARSPSWRRRRPRSPGRSAATWDR